MDAITPFISASISKCLIQSDIVSEKNGEKLRGALDKILKILLTVVLGIAAVVAGGLGGYAIAGAAGAVIVGAVSSLFAFVYTSK